MIQMVNCSVIDHYDRSGSLFLKEFWSANECHLYVYTNDKMGKLIYSINMIVRSIKRDGLEQGFSSIEDAKKALLQEVLFAG